MSLQVDSAVKEAEAVSAQADLTDQEDQEVKIVIFVVINFSFSYPWCEFLGPGGE